VDTSRSVRSGFEPRPKSYHNKTAPA